MEGFGNEMDKQKKSVEKWIYEMCLYMVEQK